MLNENVFIRQAYLVIHSLKWCTTRVARYKKLQAKFVDKQLLKRPNPQKLKKAKIKAKFW